MPAMCLNLETSLPAPTTTVRRLLLIDYRMLQDMPHLKYWQYVRKETFWWRQRLTVVTPTWNSKASRTRPHRRRIRLWLLARAPLLRA